MALGRRKALKAKPRGKGSRAEREIIDILKLNGYHEARRNFQSGGQGGGDILNGPPDVHIEVKHQETCKIWEWIAQAEADARPTDVASVWFRKNHTGWYICIPRDEMWQLLTPDPARFTMTHREQVRCSIWKWLKEAELLNPTFVNVLVVNRPGESVYAIFPLQIYLDALARRRARDMDKYHATQV